MACNPELKRTIMDANTIHFEAVCGNEKCTSGKPCKPEIKGLSEHDKRYTVTISGGGARVADAVVHVELDITKDDEVEVEACCFCGDEEEGKRDTYRFHHTVPLTPERVVEDLASFGHLVRRIFF